MPIAAQTTDNIEDVILGHLGPEAYLTAQVVRTFMNGLPGTESRLLRLTRQVSTEEVGKAFANLLESGRVEHRTAPKTGWDEYRLTNLKKARIPDTRLAEPVATPAATFAT